MTTPEIVITVLCTINVGLGMVFIGLLVIKESASPITKWVKPEVTKNSPVHYMTEEHEDKIFNESQLKQ